MLVFSKFAGLSIGFLKILWTFLGLSFPTSIYLFKVNRNARTVWRICSALTLNTLNGVAPVSLWCTGELSDFLVFPLSALWKSKCFIQTKFSVCVAHKLQVAEMLWVWYKKQLGQPGYYVRDCHQILLLILREFKRINLLPFPLKSSENSRRFDDLRGNRSQLICSI